VQFIDRKIVACCSVSMPQFIGIDRACFSSNLTASIHLFLVYFWPGLEVKTA
jgi:hypothetical protein